MRLYTRIKLQHVLYLWIIPYLMCTLGYAKVFDSTPRQNTTVKTSKKKDVNTSQPATWKKLLATSYTLGPGIFISGGGHYIIDQKKTAKKLFWIKLSGVGGLMLGGTLLARSGASNVVTPWVIPLLITSAATFVGSSLADLLGVWSQSNSKSHLPQLSMAPLTDYKGNLVLNTSVALRQTAIEPYHLFHHIHWVQQINTWAYDVYASRIDQQQRYELHIEKYMTQGHGWSLWGRVGAVNHMNQKASFSFYQGELSMWASFRLGQLIAASVSQLSSDIWIGWGGGGISYGSNAHDQITAVLGGMRFTHHSFHDHLRISATYDHRHDGWVGGAIVPGLGSGILGSLKLSVSTRINQYFWLESYAQFGTAHVGAIMLSWYGDRS